MSSKVLVVISTVQKEKALAGLGLAKVAMQRGLMDEVKVVFFGTSCEQLLSKDEDVQSAVKDFIDKGNIVACKGLADRAGISEDIAELGVPVEYVGTIIFDAIKDGFTPMVF